MQISKHQKFLLGLLIIVFCSALALGQGIVTGSMSGTVVDQQGAVVQGATATAVEVTTNRTFTDHTTATGYLSFSNLPPGTYQVTIEAPGFRKYEARDVGVAVGKDTSLGAVTMLIGAAEETVRVEGTAPLVEATTDQIATTFNERQTASLPIGNSFDSLALFIPGVATAGDGSFSNNNGAELVVNGQRARSNNYQIDGQGNNDNSVGGPSIFFGNQDAISEMQVVTNYSAEYGRNMGAVVNYVTKSGTNAFHGTAFEMHQNSAFDSLENQEKSPLFGYCAPGQNPDTGCTVPKVSKFIDNRFGGTVGGPILKDKLWFFGSTNFERQRSAGVASSSGASVTPTPTGLQQLQAAFPNSPGVAALASFGPAAIKAGNPAFTNLQTMPVSDGLTTVPIQFGTITRMVTSPYNDYEATGRIDAQIGTKDRFFGRYVFQQNSSGGVDQGLGIANGDWQDVPGRDQQMGLDWVHTFSANFINQVRFSYSRAGFGFEGGSFPNCTRANISDCPPQISFTSAGDLNFGRSSAMPQGRIINVYQVQDNVSWQRGKHTLKVGGEFDRQRSPNVFLPNVNGSFVFSDFNALVANTPSTVSITSGNPKLPFTENDFAFYFQDDWRVKENLTLNLGLRWEFYGQAINLLHDRTVAQQTGPNPFWDTNLPLNLTTIPQIPNNYKNFAPVVGFAWTPRAWKGFFGEDQTVIRGGFRISYDPQFYNMFLNTATASPVVNAGQFPVSGSDVVPGMPAGALTGAAIQAALLPLVPTGGNPGARRETLVSHDFHNPYSEQWNFGVQRFIGSKRVAAEVRYVGNHTVGNFQNLNGNPALNALIDAGFANVIPAGYAPCATPDTPGHSQGYIDCNRTRVTERANTAFSIYHGLQSELRIAGWHGLSATASYTFSKTIDNASEVYNSFGGGGTLSYAQDPFQTSRPERAVSGIDYPHVFGLAMVYDLPFYKSQQGFLGHLLGGWQWNNTYRYTSGQPYTATQYHAAGSLCDPTSTMSGTYDACRPIVSNPAASLTSAGMCTDSTAPECGIIDLVSGNPTTLSAVRWVINDPTAAAYFGSPYKGVGRNTLRGQPISTVNTAVFKNTKITERLTAQFQFHVFNLFNTQFLGVPDTFVDDAAVKMFANASWNANGGYTFAGNTTTDGITRRRLMFGMKLIF